MTTIPAMARIEWRRYVVLRRLGWWVPLATVATAFYYLLCRLAGPHPGFWVTGAVGVGAEMP